MNEKIFPKLKGMDALNQKLIDQTMIELDGTESKTNLGANAMLGVSLAVLKAGAKFKKEELYAYLGNKKILPRCMMNILNGGAHAENKLEFQEFMIFSPKDYKKNTLNEHYLDLFWEMKFKLNPIHVPEFLTRIAEKILFIGKSLNIIRECGKIIKCPFENEFDTFSTNNTNKPKTEEITEDNSNPNNEMIFENERLIQFEKLIEKIYIWTNETLKSILFKEKSLDSLIKSFKRFYLMESGDFYTYLIDLVNEMFFIEKKELKFEKLQTHIDNAIRITSANSDVNKDQFYFVLSNMAITMEKDYLDKYSEILSSNENDIQKITDQLTMLNHEQSAVDLDDMKIYESLSLLKKKTL